MKTDEALLNVMTFCWARSESLSVSKKLYKKSFDYLIKNFELVEKIKSTIIENRTKERLEYDLTENADEQLILLGEIRAYSEIVTLFVASGVLENE